MNNTSNKKYQLKTVAILVAGIFGPQGAVLAAEKVAVLETSTVEVVSTTPLTGVGLPIEQLSSSVQVVKGEEMQNQQSLTIADYMSQNMVGVNVNETQNNPFQPNVNFRGFTASPLLGTPQGISVYQDGVRINEPFGDVVSWDLVPMNALAGMTMMPGSNPLFGLNTLGGAISLQTKRGRTHQGGAVEMSGGSWNRKNGQVEYGGVQGNVDYFVAGNYFDEDGWRDASPTKVKQFFGQLGWQNETTDLNLTVTAADNDMVGNGLQAADLIQSLGWDSIYTKPDRTENKMVFINLNGSHWLSEKTMFSGNVYYRNARTRTLNGDINDGVDPAGILAAGECGNNGVFEEDETCGGALNRTRSNRTGYGFTGQFTFDQDLLGHKNQFVAGAGYDHGRTTFGQTTEFGSITADRGVAAIGIFDTGNEVQLRGVNKTWSVFATDTFSINDITHLTLSGRYNHTKVDNLDRLDPVPNPDPLLNTSLTGNHNFSRFNPAIGLAVAPSKALSFFGGYNEGSRAPTAIELGCANANQPCKLPNAMAGDPPLSMVVSRTFEGGIRGKLANGLGYSASIYRTRNSDDIQFIASSTNGSGYFDNVGDTLRKGLDLGLNGDIGTFRWFAGYSYVDATYESQFSIAREQEVNDSAVDQGCGDLPVGVEAICVHKGDRIPGIPKHQFKLRAEWQALPQWSIGTNLVAFSDQYSHGNENNGHAGAGAKSGGYTVVNLDTRYKFGNSGWQMFAKVNNVFDREYYSGGMLGSNFFNQDGSFDAGDSTGAAFYAPGAPRAGWVGVRYEFGGKKSSSVVNVD